MEMKMDNELLRSRANDEEIAKQYYLIKNMLI